MRVLKLFFTTFFLLFFIIGIGFLITREVLLFWGVTQLKSSISQMKKTAHNSGKYIRDCAKRGGSALQSEQGFISTIQVRFLSDKNYVTEVVCEYESHNPLVIKEHTLPIFVTKYPGESGLVWGPETVSSVTLRIFGRKQTIVLQEDEVVVYQGRKNVEGVQPIGQCSAFGFTCCDEVLEFGEGEQITNVLDCHQNCYRSCNKRPVVLRFSSDPTIDNKTRQVFLKRGVTISFFYVIDPADFENVVGKIDFGDGNVETLSEFSGEITHQYQCNQLICHFTASIQAIAQENIESVATPLTKILVKVQ